MFRKVAGLLFIYTYGTIILGLVGIIQDKKKIPMLLVLAAVEIDGCENYLLVLVVVRSV